MTANSKLFVYIVVAFGLACATALAQKKPNFSGEWNINLEKSDFGSWPAPSKYERKIDHEEPNLHTVTTQVGQRGEFTSEMKYTTDGQECTNTIRDFVIKSTAKWDGNTLVIESKGDMQGNEFTWTEKWNLSEEGKTLTIDSHMVSSKGEADLKVVLEKQG